MDRYELLRTAPDIGLFATLVEPATSESVQIRTTRALAMFLSWFRVSVRFITLQKATL